MTPITSASPAIAPDAMIAIPEHHPTHRRTGPLRSGNPRGNPNLAPRCGAKARTTGCPCRAPTMPNGRCRMHGGKSTGPRTPEGFASLARARTTHGLYAQSAPAAELRAQIHHARVAARRLRMNGAAFDLLPWLPPAFAARLRADTATELHAPTDDARRQTAPAAVAPNPTDHPPAPATPQPPGPNPHPRRDARGKFAPPPPRPLRGRQAERTQARAEATALAPWKLAIVQACTAMRQARTAARAKPRTDLVASAQENSAPAPARPPPQNARFGKHRIYPMEPETEPPGPTPPGQDARFGKLRIYPMDPEPGPPGPRPPEQDARFEKSRTNPMEPATALPPGTPPEAADASCAKTPTQRGTMAPSAGPGAAAG